MTATAAGAPHGSAYLDHVRAEIIGRDLAFELPFGLRHFFYADYTASGRGLGFIERRLFEIQKSYANTHTEDDYSGRRLTSLLKQAERRIKELVNAGPQGKVIPVGSGATGALQKLQEIIGVYLPPHTRERLGGGRSGRGFRCRRPPVVFVGPYEHHTNELMWREAFAEVVVVGLSAAGGGTVIYVGFDGQDYSEDIETRELAGTPPILQTIRAALAMEVKARIGPETIDRLERRHLARFLGRLSGIDNLELIGRYDGADLTPIVSFNIRHKDRILHPKFVTRLLNDLFGIQSRAGCSCAGPYGHVLLGIDEPTSRRFRELILKGRQGIKPGWVRINLHSTFTDRDVDFLARAIAFAARHGHAFLGRYAFDLGAGEWRPAGFSEATPELDLDGRERARTVDLSRLGALRAGYFRRARSLALALERAGEPRWLEDPADVEALKGFYYARRA